MKTLYIYSSNSCQNCQKAKSFLIENDVPHKVIDLNRNPEHRNWLRRAGHTSLPVMLVDNTDLLVPGGYNSLRTMRREEIIERLI